ncbi:MAG: hypothetical protein B6244_03080, partial [Candidatus Cloacimonetes bacterium 4572_55]
MRSKLHVITILTTFLFLVGGATFAVANMPGSDLGNTYQPNKGDTLEKENMPKIYLGNTYQPDKGDTLEKENMPKTYLGNTYQPVEKPEVFITPALPDENVIRQGGDTFDDAFVIACNDDYHTGDPCGSYVSFIGSLAIDAGTYYVVVDGYGTDSGEYTLLVEEAVPCDDVLVPNGTPEIEPNGGTNSDPVEYDPRNVGSEAAPTLITGTYLADAETRDTDWFNFTLNEAMTVYATVDVSCGDPQLLIVDPTGSSILAEGTANGEGEGEELSVELPAGADYWLWMGSQVFSGDGTEFNYNIEFWGEELVLQEGDTFENAFVIDALPFTDTGTTVGYINDYDEVCPYSGSTSPDVVYEWTATEGIYNLDLCGSLYDTKLYVYAADQLTVVACNDDYHTG